MRRFCLLLLCVFVLTPVVHAEPDPLLDSLQEGRAKILAAEMRRRSVDLVAFLQPDADPTLRRLAIRALGRIGDDGNGPGIIRDMLATETRDLDILLWAAGAAMSEELVESLADELEEQLDAGKVELAAAAAKALGWKGGDVAREKLVPLLAHKAPEIRAAALIGLGRSRFPSKEALDAASKLAHDDNEDVCRAAEYACWLMSRPWATKAKKEDERWDGEPEIARRFVKHLSHYDPERRMGGIRVLGILLPETISYEGPFAGVFELVDDEDPRVVQDAIWRIFQSRTGDAVDAQLVVALHHADPKTRSQAAKALGAHGAKAEGKDPSQAAALLARFAQETDARVREDLVVELARLGDEGPWKELQKGKRAADPVVRQATDAQVLLLSKRPEAVGELFQWADPGASQRAGLHAATWMTVLSGIEEKEGEVPGLDAWLLGFLDGGYAIDRDERPFVVSSAVSVVAAKKCQALAPKLLEILGRSHSGKPPHDEIHDTKVHAEVRMALMSAFGDLAADEGTKPEVAAAMKAAVAKHMLEDPSPWVRLKARDAARKLKLEDVPDVDVKQPTDWKGVPRAETRNAAVDPAGDSAYLDEREILQVADWIATHDPTIVIETTAGTFTVGLDPKASPVHCVSFLNAVRNGVYDGTRWHRVVPNFVIQGGDPHGHGAGGGGWHVPDEINERPYVRGALGMPKSVKDDGGCQLFFMHTAYHPLDGRYTNYGDVRSGLDAVDRIRVGDFITKAYVVVRLR